MNILNNEWASDAGTIPFTWSAARGQYECDYTGAALGVTIEYIGSRPVAPGDMLEYDIYVDEVVIAGADSSLLMQILDNGTPGVAISSFNTATATPFSAGGGGTSAYPNTLPGLKLVDLSNSAATFTRLKISISPTTAVSQGGGGGGGGLNCDCVVPYNTDTLSNMRRRMMVRLGYAASANNPPPGMVELLNDFLMESQRFLFEKVASFRDSRYFSWSLQQGVRLYGLANSDEPCGLPFLPEQIEGVWVVDGSPGSERWNQLDCGINASLYSGGFRESWPQRYDVRQCIEVWPTPDARAGQLVIKAKSGLGEFAVDDDSTSIDADLVFLLALANAKTHYGKPDAQAYGGMVQSRIADIVAAQHLTKRYIPGDGFGWVPPEPYMVDGWIP